jgi:hypothetical protein
MEAVLWNPIEIKDKSVWMYKLIRIIQFGQFLDAISGL